MPRLIHRILKYNMMKCDFENMITLQNNKDKHTRQFIVV